MADLVERIQQAMEATTKGKWCQFHPSYADEAKGTPFSEWDSSHDMSAFTDGHRSRIASFKHADDAAYVDAVSPENISALLSEILRLREENARIRRETIEEAIDAIKKSANPDALGFVVTGPAGVLLRAAAYVRALLPAEEEKHAG